MLSSDKKKTDRETNKDESIPFGGGKYANIHVAIGLHFIMIGGVENKWLYQGQNYNKW